MAQRNFIFTPEGWEEYQYWLKQDGKTTNKINQLINDARRNPFDGLGKPEPLKENYTGLWSRRIDDKNRLIYAVTDEEIRIVGCRFHY
jgi:toxin YoeB